MRYKIKLLLNVFFFLICSCSHIVEVEDISKEEITILAPSDESTLNQSFITFSWEPIEFAELYQLQIATPNFENASQILEDTLISDNGFYKSLNQGVYEWRVRGLNSAFKTSYQLQSFRIEN